MLGYREALELSSEVLDNSLSYIGGKVATDSIKAEEAIPVLVYNSLNWERGDICQTNVVFETPVSGFELFKQDGQRVEYQILDLKEDEEGIREAEIKFVVEDAPSVGYTSYYLLPSAYLPVSEISAGENIIENKYFRIEVDSNHGGIISLYDKEKQKELLNLNSGPGNEIVALHEKGDRNEPGWEVFTTGEKVFSRDCNAEIIKEEGPIASKLTISGQIKDCKRCQEITLYKDLDRIDFKTSLEEYQGQDDLFVVTFPSSLKGLEPVFEDRFSTLTKRKSKGYLDFKTHQWQNFSECGARQAHQWMELGKSAEICCGTGEEQRNYTLGMVGLIIPHLERVNSLIEPLLKALIKSGITTTPIFDDLDYERRKDLREEDCTLPGQDINEDLPWGTSFRIALDLNGQNTYVQKLLKNLKSEKKDIIISKMDKDGVITYLLNDDDLPEGWGDLPVLIISASSRDKLTEAINKISLDLDDHKIELPAEVDFIKKDKGGDNYGLALINSGNVLNSIEEDNTLVLFLMHTAAWGQTPWGPDRLDCFLVPELKSQVYNYALYPHSGDWRQAKTYRVAYEYNNPLLARQTEKSAGDLSLKESFIQSGDNDLVLTAMKQAGNKLAGFKSQQENKGITVRAYDPVGSTSDINIKFFEPLLSCHRSNLLEEKTAQLMIDENGFSDSINSNSIETYQFKAVQKYSKNNQPLGREKELQQPVYFRHWRHNLGAGPLGYSSVSISLQGEVKNNTAIDQGGVSINRIQLGLANYYVDRSIHGEAEIIVPGNWKAIPAVVPYDIEPGSEKSIPIMIGFIGRDSKFIPAEREGLIKARLRHEGQVYQDVKEVGREFLLDCKAEYREQEIKITLQNNNKVNIEGEVYLQVPLEYWPQSKRFQRGRIFPLEQGFSILPEEDKELSFATEFLTTGIIDNLSSELWAIVRVVYNGHVEYIPVSGLFREGNY